MSKSVIRITAILLCALFICGAVATMIPTHAETGETEVVFRAVWNDPYEYASASVMLCRYQDAAGKIPISDDISFNITRANSWEFHLNLEPGYYKIQHIVPVNEWSEYVFGDTDVFEVRGNIMTVYCPVLHENETIVEEPDSWIVHDKSDDTYYMWKSDDDTKPDSDTAKPLETRDPGTLTPDDSLTTNTPSKTDDINVEKKHDNPISTQSQKIGTYIFYGILAVIIIACGVLLFKRRR